jgi:hypothetical protein
MLSSITPLVERGKGNRFGVTAASFLIGATLGGLALGAVIRVVRLAGDALFGAPTPSVALVGIGAVALACGLVDVAAPNARLWGWRRQVNERWLDEYRGSVYGFGFGAQLGFGLVTIISSASMYAVVVAAALQPTIAGVWLVAGAFGFARGSSVFATARIDRRERLLAFHRRLASAYPAVGRYTGVGLAAVGVIALAGGGV